MSESAKKRRREGTTFGHAPESARRPLGTVARGARVAVLVAAVVAVAFLVTAVVVAAIVGGGFGAKAPVASGAWRSDTLVVMAHRGSTDEHPENSRAAFEAARRNGFTAVEIDVKRSVDGRFYLFHDRRSVRLLNVDVDLNRLTLRELQRFPLHWRGRETDQHILSLSTFADRFADDFVVYLDIKRHGNDDYRQLAEEIAGFVDERNLTERVVVGGDFLFVTYLEFRFPALNTCIGSPGDVRARTYFWIPRRFRPDFAISRFDEITPGHRRWLRENGLTDRWIVSGIDPDALPRALEWGFSKLLLD